jgi:hypothetical protein
LAACAAIAPLAALAVLRGEGIPAVAVGWGAALAAWRIWSPRHAWAAGLVASVGAAGLHIAIPLAALLAVALAVAAWWPRFGALAVGTATLAAGPLPVAAAAIATGAALAFIPHRLPAARQGSPALVLRAALLLAVAALVVLSFLGRLASLGPALGTVGLVALGMACVAAALVAWRAQDGARLAWSLAPLVLWPFAAAPFLDAALRPGLAMLVVVAAVQVPVVLGLATRGMRASAGVGASVAVALAWAGSVVLLAR